MTIDKYLANPASKFATVAMTDTNGLLRGQMVAADSLAGLVKNGMGMAPAQLALDPTDELLNLPGVTDEAGDFHDGLLKIDPQTARTLPWSEEGHDLLLLSQFADETAEFCPRALLQKIIQRATDTGYKAHYGLELEYTLFDETDESAQAKNFRNLKTATLHKSHDLLIYQVLQSDWYKAVSDMCDSLGIKVTKMHEEIGGGFMEICIDAGSGIEPADQVVLLKNFLRMLAMREDKCVTFMPRWSEQADSQSMHLHMSLLDPEGNAIFYDESAEHAMSCFRVVGHSPSSLRVENRLAGSDVNPYFNVAATLAAGLDGVQNKIEPHDAVVGAGFGLSDVPDYARSMPEAIERLQNSEFANNCFGERFVTTFTSSRQSQYDAFSVKVPDVELERFFGLG